MSRRTRVAVFATHPIQYQAPLWRKLASRDDLTVHVYFGTDMSVRGYRDEAFGTTFKWDVPLVSGYAHTFLSTDPKIESVTPYRPRAVGAHAKLRDFRPDVVLLTAYNALFYVDAWRAARRLGARVVMRHEASDVAHNRSGAKALVRDSVLRFLYGRVNGFAAIGTEARRHLLRLGVATHRIGSSPYCVDSDFVEQQVQQWRPQRAALRASLGIGDNEIAFVFSGKLIPKKEPLLLLAALQSLPAEVRARVHLIVAGSGELGDQMVAANGAGPTIRLHRLGFLNQTEIGRAYAVADALVLPSRAGAGETWGLVVNEGMQFGLPAIVSDGVGCHADLIVEGRTGYVFPSGQREALTARLAQFAGQAAAARVEMGAAARHQVEAFSLTAAADGLAQIVQAAIL